MWFAFSGEEETIVSFAQAQGYDNADPIISMFVEINEECCIVGAMDSVTTVIALNALAHKHRLEVFRLLVQAGPEGLPAATISSRLDVRPSALSFHLKDLVQADLIQARHAGRQIFYTARFETMNGLIGYLTENCCGGNPCSPVCTADCSSEGEPQ